MKYYAVIDTNVIVSALLSKNEDSATVKTIFKIFDKSIIPVFSKEIIAEYSEVLSRGKFKNKFSTKNVHKAIKWVPKKDLLKLDWAKADLPVAKKLFAENAALKENIQK